MTYYVHNGRPGLYLEIAMPGACVDCGAEFGGYTDDDHRCDLAEVRRRAVGDLQDENRRLRDALDEIAMNAEGLVKGGLPHFSRKEFAETVAFRARHALKGNV